MTHVQLPVFVFMLAWPALVAGQNAPVARVLDLQGEVSIHDASGKLRKAALYATIYAGERVSGQAKATCVIGFRSDGHLERFSGPFESTIAEKRGEPAGVRQQRPTAPAQKSAGKWISELPDFTTAGVEIARGGKDPLPRLVPIQNSVILSDRPTFSWPSVPPAHGYRLNVFQGNRRVWSAAAAGTTLEYQGPQALQPGVEYEWEVVFQTGDRKAYVAKFTVASETERQAAADMSEALDGAEPAWLALAALHFQQHRLYAEAMNTFERLTKHSPKVAYHHAALASLYATAGRAAESQASERRARELGYKFEDDD